MNPITYPARPRQGGPLPLALEAGAYKDHDGEVSLEPKFNGWRAMVHTPTGLMFNRQGAPLTIGKEFEYVLGKLRALDTPFEWLDCEGLERRHGIGRGSLVIIDWMVREPMAYRQRRAILELFFTTANVGMENFFHENSLRLMPRHELGIAAHLWQRLQEVNLSLGCVFYEGVVVKFKGSEYPIQLRSPTEEFAYWVKHRFTTK